ncbi:MAG: cation:proton antiporter [Sphaerochaetaceae bacterium]|nr:cation:proton antiporter [Sphaerochaetaceae bacterium]
MSEEMMVLMLQLGFILIATKFIGYVFAKYLKQPKVLGELVAGMIIGPYLLGGLALGSFGPLFPLPLNSTVPVSPALYGISTLGSIFLLFDSGLETDLPTFIKFSGKATVIGLSGVIVSFFLGAGITVLLRPEVSSLMDPSALFLGTVCTATSIGITARILGENKKIATPEGVTIMAAAVLDDVISIVLLSVVVGISSVQLEGGAIDWGMIGNVAFKAIAFWAICMVLGIILAPHFTKNMKRLGQLPLITEVAFGIALVLAGLSEMAGLAMIIGAYITGLSLSQTDVAHALSARIESVSEFFVPVFFAVMGMMVNFSALKSVLGFALIFAVIAFIGKLVGCGLPALFVGFNARGAFRIGSGMLPRGEVTLIVAGIGLASGAINHELFGVAVMTMLVASVAAPPMLVAAFKAPGSGYKKKLNLKQNENQVTIELDFPSLRTAQFICDSVMDGFVQEGFFVSTLDTSKVASYHIRKEDVIIQLDILREEEDQAKVKFFCNEEDESFVRLMMLDSVADFQEFAETISSMKDSEMMSSQLLINMFSIK